MPRYRRSLWPAVVIAAAVIPAACGHSGTASGPREQVNPGARTAEHFDSDAATLSIEDFIQRKVPGIVIHRSGSSLSVQIRGPGTLGSATNALVVIDGVPQDSPSSLLSLRPVEIERVQVLKDAAASQYGVRGANGVLVVTLKRRS